jgi:hypothetical protein
VVPLSPEQITTLITDCWTPPRTALPRSPRDATAPAPGQPPEHDPWRPDSSTEVDPWAQLPAYPRDEMRPGIGDSPGQPAVDCSLLDDQVLDRDPSLGAALDRALVADELVVDGDVTVEGDLGDDEAGWWGR